MSSAIGTSAQTPASLLQEAIAIDHALIETEEMSRQRTGALELVSRCNVLLGVIARDATASSTESLGRMASARALLCKAAVRLAMLETEMSAVSRWIALACNQSADLLLHAAASAPSHAVQRALNEVAHGLAVALLAADTADRPRLRDLLGRCLDRFNANGAVIDAENELGVDALNDAVVLGALADKALLSSDRAACFDKATSSGRIAVDHFDRIGNFEFRSKAENLLRQFAHQREHATGNASPELPAAAIAQTAPASASASAPAPRFCGACGAGVQPDWKFCKACGAPLKPRTSAAPGGTH